MFECPPDVGLALTAARAPPLPKATGGRFPQATALPSPPSLFPPPPTPPALFAMLPCGRRPRLPCGRRRAGVEGEVRPSGTWGQTHISGHSIWVDLVAQCSATPATVPATPPCSATPFQTQISVRHLPGMGGGSQESAKGAGGKGARVLNCHNFFFTPDRETRRIDHTTTEGTAERKMRQFATPAPFTPAPFRPF